MNTITEQENFSGPGIGVETEPNYANAVKKGYFIPSTGKWDGEKMKKDGLIKKVEPEKEVPAKPEVTTPVEPETTTPVEPVTPKIEPLPQPEPEPEVDVEREVEALSEQLKRIKKLMGM